MAHFYLNEFLLSAEIGGTAELVGAEARHAVTVSRVKPGDALTMGNGAGLVVSGTVRTADATQLTIDVESVQLEPAAAPAIWLAQALAKGDRDELAVQAATELGVDGVIPWSASRSISRWEGAKVVKGHDRWVAIVREATKQSVRAWMPEVADLVSTKQLVALAASAQVLVLDPTGEQALTEIETDTRDVVLVVGPEGGIADQELHALRTAGASIVRLGRTVLRTSTAGPAAIAVLSAKLGRW
ncbi:16S rRNA (uracil(1498)-N(3))-methyltransferase [Glaciihabitans sp. dw_435]|uniref:16S rRNA (uracil(1498)-N(3))-methyltransferase n=1 Tax=Glaciihabitans sp. dw_435 TaxID=2720081 RepID=UPI001BD6778D|nr:16S rRNA (uracil(1498)-N(3))-methyltransferase [Glaciihabitans sp. dw_435]